MKRPKEQNANLYKRKRRSAGNSEIKLQKHARSKCEISPLLRADFCIMLQNFALLGYLEPALF